uniref:Uncharacterized protein n=1 Tax=Alexandrium monilatum TaxID=311494 RepID=A0A7S4RK53_9DINO
MAGVAFLNHVPHYDVFGHHHHREPYRDKSHLLQEEIRHPKWLGPKPSVRTRSELQMARKRSTVPDPSYDFDGDGVVGQRDFFIGRSFDKDRDGRLTDAERAQAKQALANGFMDKHVVINEDARAEKSPDCQGSEMGGLMYPPHHNANIIPDVATQTALNLNRRAELKGAGTAFGERYAADCAPVLEPQPPNAFTEPRQCPISHIRERAEADHQASRVRAGLLPTNAPVNPERDVKEFGLDRVEEPFFGTRGQLMETRRALNKKDSEDMRMKGEENFVPGNVRRTQKDYLEFEFRRPRGESMTKTKLLDQRRQDKIEYDMANFKVPDLQQFPHFSDRPDVPFWKQGSAERAGQEPRALSRKSASEPVLKVTDVPFGYQEPERSSPIMSLTAGKPVDGSKYQCGSHTVKRWTTDMLERGQGRNKPRLFDNIQPMRIGPLDLMPLEITSSIECIRNAACKGREEERQRAAASPLRSLLFNDNTQLQPSSSGLNSRLGSKLGAGSQRDPGAETTKVTPGSALSRRAVATSDPVMRSTFNTVLSDKPREPRFFGSMTRPMSSTGVRCGGFQRFEPPPKQARGHKGGRGGRNEHGSKERARAENTAMSPATPGAAPTAQPL